MSWLLLLLACGGPDLPEGANELSIGTPIGHWERLGFRQLTPPVPLPSFYPDQPAVEIWVSVPDGAQLTVEPRGDGVPVFAWPPGSVADRVEYRGHGDERRVVDVRGTRIDDEGRLWDHVYRPSAKRPDAALYGYEWPAHDAAIHQGVVDVLAHRAGESVRKKMGCRACHEPMRADNTRVRENGLVNRGTDAAGWVTPSTLLRDAVPAESYGRHDAGVDHAWITVSCGEHELQRYTNKHGATRHRCSDAKVPLATRRTAPALAASDADTGRLCDDRQWLAERTAGGFGALGLGVAACIREANSNDESK